MKCLPAIVALAMPLMPLTVPADARGDLVDKYINRLQDQTCGNGVRGVISDLIDEVPASERDELFASIIDKGGQSPEADNAIPHILDILSPESFGDVWSSHLEKAVLSQNANKSPGVRRMLVGLLSKRDREKYREICLSYLDDPDQRVQFGAVCALEYWPDAVGVLSKYVRGRRYNAEDPADPVAEAKRFLGS